MVITAKKKEYKFYVAGVQHHGIKEVINELSDGFELQLELEPTNQYDPNAIKILFDSIENNSRVMLGYVPGKMSADITDFYVKAILPTCDIVTFNPDAKPWQQLLVKIYDEGEI
jgi:hypothetical protein